MFSFVLFFKAQIRHFPGGGTVITFFSILFTIVSGHAQLYTYCNLLDVMTGMSSDEDASQTSSTCSPAGCSSSPPPASHFIGKKEDIVKAGRLTLQVDGCRDVLILHHQGRLHAMDLRCYRKL